MSNTSRVKGQLTLDYDHWIQKIARKMWRKFGMVHDFEDLRSIAQIASLEAEKKYDETKGKFSAYVKPRIEGAIIRSLSTVSNSQHKLLNEAHRFIEKYILTNTNPPSQHLILQHLKINEAEFIELLKTTQKISITSLDDVGGIDLSEESDLDTQAEYEKLMTILSELPASHQTKIKEFLEDSDAPSASIQDTLDILRTKLNIKV